MSSEHRRPPGTGPQAAAAPTGQAHQPQLNGLFASFLAPALCLSGPDGQVRPGGACGLFVEDRRLLSMLVLQVDGAEPSPLTGDIGGGADNSFESVCFNVGTAIPDPTLLLTRRRRVLADGLQEQYLFRSYDRRPLRFTLGLRLASDMAEMAAVKSGARPRALEAVADGDGLRWSGPEGATVEVRAVPPPDVVGAAEGTLAWEVEVAPGGQVAFGVTARLGGEAPAGAVVRPAPSGTSLPAVSARARDPRLGLFLERSLADLSALRLTTADRPGDVFLAAGVPWFLTLFGRDSIWAARMLLPLGTELALGTLRSLASRQGRRTDAETGEEEGKILHELRRAPTQHDLWRGEGAPLRLPPAYYGTVDATLLWALLLHDAWRYGADEARVEELLDPMQRCLGWLTSSVERRDGFVSYVDESGSGLQNQGWKDSHDGIQFRDGRVATAPLSLCEVQGYAYEAAVSGAALLDAFGRPGSARLLELAQALAARFRNRFWVEDAQGAYPAAALDAAGAPVDSLTSNIGHLLGTGLLDAQEESLVVRRLATPDLDSGFGLRTLAASSAGFNPLSYHAGSVWAHDTAIVVAGLARCGTVPARQVAASLVDGLLGAAEHFEYRMPELYGGHQRTERPVPGPYPASCRPQAWSAAASVVVVSSLLGLRPDLPSRRLYVAPMDGVVGLSSVDGLRVGSSTVSLRVGEGGVVEAQGLPSGLELVVGS